MPIKFKHEATSAYIPPSASNKKYGQQLVLNQQKYANDQREMAFRQQQQNMDNQFRGGLAANQNAAQLNLQNVQGQQAMDRMKAQQAFGAQQNAAVLDLNAFKAQVQSVVTTGRAVNAFSRHVST